MKKTLLSLCYDIFILVVSCKDTDTGTEEGKDLITRVSTLVGTDSGFQLSNGNTYPAIALPFGMNFRIPQTVFMGDKRVSVI